MAKAQQSHFVCPICGSEKRGSEAIAGELVDGDLLELLREQRPEWSPSDPVCADCLHKARVDYVQEALEKEKGEISDLEGAVIRSLREQDLLSQNINAEFDEKLTLGERAADLVASFGGSWSFITAFAAFFVLWMAINTIGLVRQPFDPFPYILLNLLLSCLAAIQAPIIMMSQNRQDARDRLRAEHDYRINMKAELEIRHLHSKLDQLLSKQWHRLMEIQRLQIDLMEEIVGRNPPDRRS